MRQIVWPLAESIPISVSYKKTRMIRPIRSSDDGAFHALEINELLYDVECNFALVSPNLTVRSRRRSPRRGVDPKMSLRDQETQAPL